MKSDGVSMTTDYYFGLLALGDQYRFHARTLLNDLEFFAPHAEVFVLTDRPNEFVTHRNARVEAFRPQGVLRCYHDKRFLLQPALTSGKACVVIDANTRIVEPLPKALDLPEGISAFLTENLEEHFADAQANSIPRPFVSWSNTRDVVYRAARQLGVDPGSVTFLYEFMYAMRASHEMLAEFLANWDRLAKYMDYYGLSWSEGFAIGIAAAKVGLPIHRNPFLSPDSFYKHRLHATAIERGEKLGDRIMIAHREQRLLSQYARFGLRPAPGRRIAERLKKGLRWFTFRWTGRQFRELSSAVAEPPAPQSTITVQPRPTCNWK